MDLQNSFFNELRELKNSHPNISLNLQGGFVIVTTMVTSSRECPYEIRCSYPLELTKRDYVKYRVKPLPLTKRTEYLGSRFSWRGESYMLHPPKIVVDTLVDLIEKQERAISLKTQMEIDEQLFNFFLINKDWIDREGDYKPIENPGDN